MLSVFNARMRHEVSEEIPDIPLDPAPPAPTTDHLRRLEEACAQDRTDLVQAIADHCDLSLDGVAWRCSQSAAPVFPLNHSMEVVFPLRDLADPSRVDPRFAAAHGGIDPRVDVREVEPLAQPLKALMKLAGVPDARHSQLRDALTRDVWLEIERLIEGRRQSQRYEVRRLHADDLQPHELARVNQYGLFGWRDHLPDQCPTLENGRVLGLFVGALRENGEHNSQAIGFNLQDGRLASLTRFGAANGPSFANTALLPGSPARYDHQRLNAHLMPFRLRLTDANGQPCRVTLVALIVTNAAYGQDNPTREIRVDYGPGFLKACDDAQKASHVAAQASARACNVTVKVGTSGRCVKAKKLVPEELARWQDWCAAGSDGEHREVARQRTIAAVRAASKRLDLSGLGLLELPPLRWCSMLAKLDLSGNRLTQVSGLEALPLLTELDLKSNDLSTMPELRPSLRRLHLGDNPALRSLASGHMDEAILARGHECVVVGVEGRYRAVQMARTQSIGGRWFSAIAEKPWHTSLFQEFPRRERESGRAYAIRLVLTDPQWVMRDSDEASDLLRRFCGGNYMPVSRMAFKPALVAVLRRYPQLAVESDVSYGKRLVLFGADQRTIRRLFHLPAAFISSVGRHATSDQHPVPTTPRPPVIGVDMQSGPPLRPVLPGVPGGSAPQGLTPERREQLMQAVGPRRRRAHTVHALKLMIEAHRRGWDLSRSDITALSGLRAKDGLNIRRFCSTEGVMEILSSHPPRARELGVEYLTRLVADAGLPQESCTVLDLWRNARYRAVKAQQRIAASMIT